MQGIVCDRCGEGLLIDENARYIMKLEITAAYDPMEVTSADLEQDLDAEFAKTLREIDGDDPRELERQVHYQRSFDLCGSCRRLILADPLFQTPS